MTKVLAALAGLRVSVMMVKGGSGSTESSHRCAEGPQPGPTFLFMHVLGADRFFP